MRWTVKGAHTEPTGSLVRKISGHLDRVETKEADRAAQCLGVCTTAKRSSHLTSLTVEMEWTGISDGSGGSGVSHRHTHANTCTHQILLASYGHRSAVRPL